MQHHSPTPLTVYAAIWTCQRVTSRCRACGQLHQLDLRRLALDGHGRNSLSAIPFDCDCGSSDCEVIAEPPPDD